jgi:hypothetical protein
MAGYGFTAPTGSFEQGDPDNLGLGFWTHQLQADGPHHTHHGTKETKRG